jgi:Protein of unknown function (DUF3631)
LDRRVRRDGALVLDEVVAMLRRFVVLTPRQAIVVALWIAHTHAMEAADCTPYLMLTSAEKRSGKTRLLEVLELLVREPLPTANISDAALFRAIAEMSPTLLFDEVDAIFGSKTREREDLRAMLNAGYRRGAFARRMGGPRMTTLEAFPVFCPKAFAGIGDCLPDTIADRAIAIRLQRRTRDEHVERFRRREAQPVGAALHDQVVHWLEPQIEYLRSLRPHLPDELDDRAQDVWEPLFAIADVAGGEWPKRARVAAVELSSGEAREDDSNSVRLLRDIYAAFDESDEDRLRTGDLLARLLAIEESPWGDWYGKPLSAHALSKLLRRYRIRTMTVWSHGETVKGYKREQFADAFERVVGVREVRPGSNNGAAPNSPNPTNPYSHGDGIGQVAIPLLPPNAPAWERAYWDRRRSTTVLPVDQDEVERLADLARDLERETHEVVRR